MGEGRKASRWGRAVFNGCRFRIPRQLADLLAPNSGARGFECKLGWNGFSESGRRGS